MSEQRDERRIWVDGLADEWKKPAPEKAAARKEDDRVQLADAWAEEDPRREWLEQIQDAWKQPQPQTGDH
jgi:hypothetical protein